MDRLKKGALGFNHLFQLSNGYIRGGNNSKGDFLSFNETPKPEVVGCTVHFGFTDVVRCVARLGTSRHSDTPIRFDKVSPLPRVRNPYPQYCNLPTQDSQERISRVSLL